jgi:hypothetical protein
MKNLVQNAQARHFKKWPILGMSGPAPEIGAIATTYNAVLDTLKGWINLRLQWLDSNIPGLCVPLTTNVEQQNAINMLRFFPNPSNGTIHFEGMLNSESPVEMSVYDVTGKIVDRIVLTQSNLQFDYSLNRKGFFYFTISNKKEIIQYGKFIIM